MTIQQFVNIPATRQVRLDLLAPESLPIGRTKIEVIFIPIKANKKSKNSELCGMFADTGDTLDKFLLRKREEKQLEYAKLDMKK